MIAPSIDYSALEYWLVKKSTLMSAELGKVLAEEGSFLLETVTRITPPTDGTLSPSQSWAVGRIAGRNALLGDLARVYVTSSSVASMIAERDEDAAKGFSKAVKKRNIPEAQRIMYAYGLRDYAAHNIGPFNASFHARRKNNRGRVKGLSVSQVVTDPQALNQYKREQLAKVGQLKKGWAVSAARLKRKIRIPAWVLSATGGGGFTIDKTMQSINPYITFANTSKHGESMSRVVRFGEFALQIRENVVRRTVEQMVKRNWRKK